MSNKSFAKTPRLVIVAGVSRSLVNFRGALIQSLRDSGVEVHAVAPHLMDDGNTCRQLEAWGVIVHDVGMNRVGLNPLADFLSLASLYRLFRRIKPDKVLGYTIKPVIYGTLAAWLARVPKRYVLITGLGYAFSDQAQGKRAVVLNVVRRLYRTAIRRTHHVMFQNPDDQALFRSLSILPSHVPSTVVNGSGVDVKHFEQAPFPDAPVSFLLTARLIADKGVRLYAEAAKKIKSKHPDATCFLVGDLDDNPESIKREELDAWIESGDIEYLGRLGDVRPALANSQVFVLPTYYREGVPRTILEAMAMGRPIITTDAPGCRETVVEGENGFLVPIKSVDALAEAMQRFVDQPDLVARMGKQSRAIAEEKYDVHKVNAVMLEAMGIAYSAEKGSPKKNKTSLHSNTVA
ncbi:glycosyltransferase family 4 protein [Halomonas mongoliensis]|uniref:glycosyltransferase family 4 protein n=1 Tax=Halomonas mongoliensis TaxID=321265 RepID=UPI00403B375D